MRPPSAHLPSNAFIACWPLVVSMASPPSHLRARRDYHAVGRRALATPIPS